MLDAQNDAALCVAGKYIESNSKEDYQKNLRLFGDGGYDAVVAVGFAVGIALFVAYLTISRIDVPADQRTVEPGGPEFA